jgi:flavin-binding protein dodecin
MSNVYAVSEVVGTSDKSIEDAIDQAVAVAGQSILGFRYGAKAN